MKRTISLQCFLLLLFGLSISWSVPAQKSNLRSSIDNRIPQLTAKTDTGNKAMELAKLDVEVFIHGVLAETKMTMTFFNPHNRTLEGQFCFPLPEGAFVSGYALDIGRKMIDAVLVEKQKARVVFENIVRRGVDPGLVEWVKGNNFRTRIYPLRPRSSRTISIRYVTALSSTHDSATLHIPIAFKQTVPKFSLSIKALDLDQKPAIVKGMPEGIQFFRYQDAYHAQAQLKSYSLEQDVTIQVPVPATLNVYVAENKKGQHYFCISPIVKGESVSFKKATQPPKRITILWDTSGSRAKIDHHRELSLLKRYFTQKNNKNVAVSLVLFNHRQHRPQTFKLNGGNNDQLEEMLNTIKDAAYDGATTGSAIAPPRKGKKPNCYFVFSDGNINFGPQEPGTFKKPVYVFSADKTANHPLLRYIAQNSGGVYFNLNRTTDPQILDSIGKLPFSFISADVEPGSVAELYPHSAQPIDGRFLICGKLFSEKTVITLNFGYGGSISLRIPIEISTNKISQYRLGLMETFWAQQKISSLMVFPKKNKQELLKAGQAYGLVTPGTSLMVLEFLSDYIRYQIEPPESLPNMRSRYWSHMSRQKEKDQSSKEAKLDRIAKLWQNRISWWKKTFEPPKPKPKPKKRKHAEGQGQVLPMEMGEDFGVIGGVEGGVPGGIEGGVLGSSMPSSSKSGSMRSKPRVSTIAVKEWAPDTPYLQAIRAAGPSNAFRRYLKEKENYGNSPGFYLDCADYFIKNRQPQMGLQVLSNIAEMELDNPKLLRILGHRLNQLGYLKLSAGVFEQVVDLRPEEPQSFRDLALVLSSLKQYREAVKLLYHVITHEWNRFYEIETIVLMEMNRIIAKAGKSCLKGLNIDKRLIKLLDVDIRIVLTWDTDATDIDLWVIEPTGEKSFYGRRLTNIGGHMTRDFTRGYGPEEYTIKKALVGQYKIKADYYGTRSQKILTPVTLQVDIFTNYGRKRQEKQSITLRLEKRKNVIDVGEIGFGK